MGVLFRAGSTTLLVQEQVKKWITLSINLIFIIINNYFKKPNILWGIEKGNKHLEKRTRNFPALYEHHCISCINGFWSPHSSVSHQRQLKISKKGNKQNLSSSHFPVPKQGCCWHSTMCTLTPWKLTHSSYCFSSY